MGAAKFYGCPRRDYKKKQTDFWSFGQVTNFQTALFASKYIIRLFP